MQPNGIGSGNNAVSNLFSPYGSTVSRGSGDNRNGVIVINAQGNSLMGGEEREVRIIRRDMQDRFEIQAAVAEQNDEAQQKLLTAIQLLKIEFNNFKASFAQQIAA